MSLWSSAYLSCLTVACALLLIFGVLRYALRERAAQGLLKLPEQNRARIIKVDTSVVKLLTTVLWMSPFHLVLFPFVLVYYEDTALGIVVIPMVLFVAVIVQERLYRTWIIKRLEGAHHVP